MRHGAGKKHTPALYGLQFEIGVIHIRISHAVEHGAGRMLRAVDVEYEAVIVGIQRVRMDGVIIVLLVFLNPHFQNVKAGLVQPLAHRDEEGLHALHGEGDQFQIRFGLVKTGFRMIDLVRDRELLDTAQQEAARWFETSSPTSAGIDKLLAGWEERFKLIEIG